MGVREIERGRESVREWEGGEKVRERMSAIGEREWGKGGERERES
jgi:hypothetical protein